MNRTPAPTGGDNSDSWNAETPRSHHGSSGFLCQRVNEATAGLLLSVQGSSGDRTFDVFVGEIEHNLYSGAVIVDQQG